MRLPFITRRRHQHELTCQQRGYQLLIRQITEKNRDALAMVATELSTTKDVIALHIVAAGHPSTVLHTPEACMDALGQALADAGVDLRWELARLEGAQL